MRAVRTFRGSRTQDEQPLATSIAIEVQASSRLSRSGDLLDVISSGAPSRVPRGREIAAQNTPEGFGLAFIEDNFFAVSSGSAQRMGAALSSSTPSQNIACALQKDARASLTAEAQRTAGMTKTTIRAARQRWKPLPL